jgi:hypothetical protein
MSTLDDNLQQRQPETKMFKLCNWIDETKLTIHLSLNPRAMKYLEEHPDKMAWHLLSQNPEAIHLLEANQDKIDWFGLSGNPEAMHLL